jgi:hypothetical protein
MSKSIFEWNYFMGVAKRKAVKDEEKELPRV